MIQKIYINYSCSISEFKSLYKAKCYSNINQCEPGTFGNNTTMQCELCPKGFYSNHIRCLECIHFKNIILGVTNCVTCTSSTECIVCSPTYGLLNQDCHNPCPTKFWLNGLVCSPCESNCDICTSPTECTVCFPTYGLLNQDCHKPCPTTFWLNSAICSPCESNCDTCTSSTVCNVCSPTYGLLN